MTTSGDQVSVISVVLLPNNDDSRLLVRLSAAISAVSQSSIQLGDGSLPHITIAQFRTPESTAEPLWRVIASYSKAVNELTAAGLVFLPSRNRNEMWVEMQFLKAEALVRLQTDILKSEFISGLELLSSSGDDYRPHCTLALLEGDSIPTYAFDDKQAFRRPYRQLSLAVGVNGGGYMLTKTLFGG